MSAYESDGVYARTSLYSGGGDSFMERLAPDMKKLLDQFHGPVVATVVARVCAQMVEFGIDPTTPEGQAKAAEVARLRLTRRTYWIDSTVERLEREAAIEASDGTEFVYYVDLYGSAIKIGYSAHVLSRVRGLRRRRSHILALEPGGRRLEALRHRQFDDERMDSGLEDFERSERLLAHIDVIRERHGDPLDVLAQAGAA